MNNLKKKNIAIVTFLCPYPVSDGGRFGVFSFVNDIRKIFNVTLVFKVPSSETQNVLALKKQWPEVDVQPFYTDNSIKTNAIRERKTLYKQLIHPIRKMKYKKRAKKEVGQKDILHGLYPFIPRERDFVDFLGTLFNNKKFDVVQIEYSDLLNLVHIIPEGAKKVFFQHENRYSILEDYFNLHEDNGAYSRYIVDTARFTEMGLMNLYDRILVLNNNDRSRLAEFVPIDKLQVMPTSVPETLIPKCKQSEKANKLVFLGSQEHHPNMDAVRWYAEEMNEEVFRSTGLTLDVTGTWKEPFRFQYSQINFTGFVDDIGHVLEGSILLAPIRLGGGGIRIKILQAMACGIPVIATSLITNGMEGIKHSENIFIADSAADVIKAIKVLSNDRDMYRKLSKRGKELIEKYYGETAAIKVKQRIFGELLEELPTGASSQWNSQIVSYSAKYRSAATSH